MWRQRYGQTAGRDEAQYRRGAVLGLTFGELFLLLAFVLLLLLALLETERRREKAAMAVYEPVRQAAEAIGASPDKIRAVIEAADRGGPDGLSRAYVAAESEGLAPDTLADVLSAVTGRPPEDFDMVREDLATGAAIRKVAPDYSSETLDALEPGSLKQALDMAGLVPADLTPDKLALALEIAEDADDPTVTAIRQALARDASLGGDVADAVRGALGPLIERTGGAVDPATGSITLPETVLFDPGKHELTPETEAFLSAFCGPWIETVSAFGARIAELRIEGHSSSEWKGVPTGDPRAYLNNLDLSQRRSAAVLAFCLSQDLSPDVAEWARQRLVAVGLSSSRPVPKPDGSEDKIRSRRVVFGFETDKRQVLDDIRTRIGEDAAPAEPAATDAANPAAPVAIRDLYEGPARVVEAGLLEVSGTRLRLASVVAPGADAVCPGPDGRDRPCGRIAAFRLAQWIGDTDVVCVPQDRRRDASGHPLVRCTRGTEDVARWLSDEGLGDAAN